MKWGILGGTFDPVHLGHLRAAEEVLESFRLDKVLFVTASRPPLKKTEGTIPFGQRLEMVRLAIEDNAAFDSSDMENRRTGKSYTIDTVREIAAANAGVELYFILGQDAFRDIRKWKDWKELLLLCNFVVISRPGCGNHSLERIMPGDYAGLFIYSRQSESFCGPTGFSIYFRNVSLLDISSTDIRERVRAGKSIRYLVPGKVREYILDNSLYKTS